MRFISASTGNSKIIKIVTPLNGSRLMIIITYLELVHLGLGYVELCFLVANVQFLFATLKLHLRMGWVSPMDLSIDSL